ncbi:MAG: helix-turn-helix domain-containing protein [Enterovibrio sp.]
MTAVEIKKARLELGLSQKDMTKALGLTCLMTYSKWELGRSTPTAAGAAAIKMLLYIKRIGALNGWIKSLN